MTEIFDHYYLWLGIPPSEQPPNHYRLLGIQLGESNPEVIERAADRQVLLLRTLQLGPHGALSERVINEVVAAKICLFNPVSREAYDSQLAAATTMSSGRIQDVPEREAVACPAFNEIRVDASSAKALRVRKGRRGQSRSGNPMVELAKIVLGGLAGLFLAVLGVSYFAGIDPLGMSSSSSSRDTTPPESLESRRVPMRVPRQDRQGPSVGVKKPGATVQPAFTVSKAGENAARAASDAVRTPPTTTAQERVAPEAGQDVQGHLIGASDDLNLAGVSLRGTHWVVDRSGPEPHLVGRAGSGQNVVFIGDYDWADYDLKFEASSDDGTLILGALFRASPDEQFYVFGIEMGDAPRWSLAQSSGSGQVTRITGGVVPRVEKDGGDRGLRWHTVRISVRGGTAACFYDEQEVTRLDDSRFKHGRVGVGILRMAGAEARFRNMVVTSPDGTSLWSGIPEAPRDSAPRPATEAVAGKEVPASGKDAGETPAGNEGEPASSGPPSEHPGVARAEQALAAARKNYETAIEVVRADMLKSVRLKDDIERKRKQPDLARLLDLKAVMDTINDFGVLPCPLDLKSHEAIKKARAPLLGALATLRRVYIDAKLDAKAKEIEQEVAELHKSDGKTEPIKVSLGVVPRANMIDTQGEAPWRNWRQLFAKLSTPFQRIENGRKLTMTIEELPNHIGRQGDWYMTDPPRRHEVVLALRLVLELREKCVNGRIHDPERLASFNNARQAVESTFARIGNNNVREFFGQLKSTLEKMAGDENR